MSSKFKSAVAYDGHRYREELIPHHWLRVLFVQAAWAVLLQLKSWDRYGLKQWIEAAKKRLHHNVLAIAHANKLARIAWAVLNNEREFEIVRRPVPSPRPA